MPLALGAPTQAAGRERLAVLQGLLQDFFMQEAKTLLGSTEVRDWLADEAPSRALFALPLLFMKTGSVPRSNGLPVEFYRVFWCQLGSDLLEVYKEALSVGQLPLSLRIGLVSLIFKKGDKAALSNWRPITIRNVNLKILAKTLSRRLTDVMGSVMQADQTCLCGLNLVLVRDVVSWAEQSDLPLALLSLDQEKGFDRVAHPFMFKVLGRMGFGLVFCDWVCLLYPLATLRSGSLVRADCAGLT